MTRQIDEIISLCETFGFMQVAPDLVALVTFAFETHPSTFNGMDFTEHRKDVLIKIATSNVQPVCTRYEQAYLK